MDFIDKNFYIRNIYNCIQNKPFTFKMKQILAGFRHQIYHPLWIHKTSWTIS